jgi:hypothetical protein
MLEGQDVVTTTPATARLDDQATTRLDGPDEQRVRQTLLRLRDRLDGRVEPELLEARVRAVFASFAGAQVREFVPILVERAVRKEFARLRDDP